MKRVEIKTLIHTALTAEAKPIIGYFHLICKNKIPFNIYANDDTALVVSGIGAQKTKEALAFAFTLFSARRAINIGIAGCVDKNIKTGSLFCATHKNLSIPYAALTSHECGVKDGSSINSYLADMEGEAFLEAAQNVEKYIFKVVSDHLDTTIPTKAKVGALIQKTIPLWSVYVG
ncbi:MAG: nucleoside phosphorylase [Campylobacteraceae bacterium]|jgi:nucleoside phosphorylase|nr:nucleoside phosphorylase [Campylobacteraceae bacterium]